MWGWEVMEIRLPVFVVILEIQNFGLFPENDLSAPDKLIIPNRTQTISLIADNQLIELYRDNERLFKYIDPHPYTHGWFAIRTVKNHMQVRNLRIVQLIPNR